MRFENVTIIFRNFAGKQNNVNPRGYRNFSIMLDKETALRLIEEGWAVKHFKDQYFVKVVVSYKGHGPEVVMAKSGKETRLTEENIQILDTIGIENANIEVYPCEWLVGSRRGVTLFLQSLTATVRPNT